VAGTGHAPAAFISKAMAEEPLFTPNFDSVLGGMSRYDKENPGVNRHNLKSFIDWVFDEDGLMIEEADQSWLALMAHINRKQEFWIKYFLGIDVEIRAKVLSKLSEEELAEFQESSGS
jgi:hypothetical protein